MRRAEAFGSRRVLMHEVCVNAVLVFVVGMLALVAALFVCSRAYIWQHEYNILVAERENEEWLLERCEDDTFYHQMRHHSALCDEIAARRQDSMWLLALKRVSQQTYLCGEASCAENARSAMEWCAQKGFAVVVVLGVLTMTLPTLSMLLYRLFFRSVLLMRRPDDGLLAYERFEPHGKKAV